MEISLRKAAALQLAIGEALKGLPLETGVTLSIYDPDPEARIAAQSAAWRAALTARSGLLDALYALRVRVGAANQAAGVNDRLAELARLEKEVQLHTQLAREEPREAPEILSARTERMRNREPAPARFVASEPQETVRTGLLSREEVDGFQAELRRLTRRRQQLKDELLELNISTRITLDETTVRTLKSEELI